MMRGKNNVYMYRLFGISEWEEKCAILERYEKLCILKDLKEGKDTPLVALAKLPFPKFASIYFRKYPDATEYIKDPAFGYKLFILSNANKRRFKNIVEGFPSQHAKNTELKELIQDHLRMSLEELAKKVSNNQKQFRSFIYITRYIDLEEAKNLGLSKASIFEADGVDGYELFSKLSCLNTTTRIVMVKFLGLYGNSPHLINDIAEGLHLPKETVSRIIKMLLPCMSLTLGEFKNKLGFVEKDYEQNEYMEYRNKEFRDLDLRLQVAFVYNFVLSNLERSALGGYNPKTIYLYLISKYIIKDSSKVSEYLVIDKNIVDRCMNLRGL